MPSSAKPQRIRDPLHNLIEFDSGQFERSLWRTIQTRPFQRLRRVKQLGFSEFVFPGATHTRFSHSIGVFHTARLLTGVIRQIQGESEQNHQCKVALAAALVHDVGHGMFSHSFENVGKRLDLKMARHESVSELLIRDGEISKALNDELGSGFAKDVADLLKKKESGNIYESVVSSQFDADRLDYMQRDRLMTGVQSSGIDATWLLANLEIAAVSASADNEQSKMVDTFVLGPKAFHAAENYVLSLFQLYPNVYLHKTTRGAEKLFAHLMLHLVGLVRDGHSNKTGLEENHPIVKFAHDASKLEHALQLDDSVFWGALPMMLEAENNQVQCWALALKERRLPKCIDIRRRVDEYVPMKQDMTPSERQERDARVSLACQNIISVLKDLAAERIGSRQAILIDEDRRTPYKRFQDSKTQLNQILIKQGDEQTVDMATLSPVVSSASAFEICRAYYFEGDEQGKSVIEEQIKNISIGAGK